MSTKEIAKTIRALIRVRCGHQIGDDTYSKLTLKIDREMKKIDNLRFNHLINKMTALEMDLQELHIILDTYQYGSTIYGLTLDTIHKLEDRLKATTKKYEDAELLAA